MSRKDVIRTEGVIVEKLPTAQFKVRLSNGRTILTTFAYLNRMGYLTLLPGDNVIVEIPKHNLSKGTIVGKAN